MGFEDNAGQKQGRFREHACTQDSPYLDCGKNGNSGRYYLQIPKTLKKKEKNLGILRTPETMEGL